MATKLFYKKLLAAVLLLCLELVSKGQVLTNLTRAKRIEAVDSFKLKSVSITDILTFGANNLTDNRKLPSKRWVDSNFQRKNADFSTGLLSTGGITILDTVVTIAQPIVYKRNGITTTVTSNQVFAIAKAAAGYFAKRSIFIDSMGVFQLLSGSVDTLLSIPAVLPDKSILVTVVDVFGGTVFPPVPVHTTVEWLVGGQSDYSPVVKLGLLNNKSIHFLTNGIDRMLLDSIGDLSVNPTGIAGFKFHSASGIDNYYPYLSLRQFGSDGVLNFGTFAGGPYGTYGSGLWTSWYSAISLRSYYGTVIKQTGPGDNPHILQLQNVGGTPIMRVYDDGQASFGPVGTIPNYGAALDIQSTSKGVALPRLTQTQIDAIPKAISGFTITGGSGYTSAPTVVFNGFPNPYDFTVSVAAGSVTGVIYNTSRRPLSNNPTYTFSFTGGGGTGATMTPVIEQYAHGLLVYNTTIEGFQFWNGTVWETLGTGSGGSSVSIDSLGEIIKTKASIRTNIGDFVAKLKNRTVNSDSLITLLFWGNSIFGRTYNAEMSEGSNTVYAPPGMYRQNIARRILDSFQLKGSNLKYYPAKNMTGFVTQSTGGSYPADNSFVALSGTWSNWANNDYTYFRETTTNGDFITFQLDSGFTHASLIAQRQENAPDIVNVMVSVNGGAYMLPSAAGLVGGDVINLLRPAHIYGGMLQRFYRVNYTGLITANTYKFKFTKNSTYSLRSFSVWGMEAWKNKSLRVINAGRGGHTLDLLNEYINDDILSTNYKADAAFFEIPLLNEVVINDSVATQKFLDSVLLQIKNNGIPTVIIIPHPSGIETANYITYIRIARAYAAKYAFETIDMYDNWIPASWTSDNIHLNDAGVTQYFNRISTTLKNGFVQKITVIDPAQLIINSTSLQPGANFNIAGNGTIGTKLKVGNPADAYSNVSVQGGIQATGVNVLGSADHYPSNGGALVLEGLPGTSQASVKTVINGSGAPGPLLLNPDGGPVRIGIGTAGNASAAFQIESTTGGLLIPRLTTLQQNALVNPADGLKIYNTTVRKEMIYDTSKHQFTPIIAATDITEFVALSGVVIDTTGEYITGYTQLKFNPAYFRDSVISTNFVQKNATYTVSLIDHTIECTANTFTLTLPSAVGVAGKEYWITNSGAGTITITTVSSQQFKNISGTPTTLSIAPFANYCIKSNGANWIAR